MGPASDLRQKECPRLLSRPAPLAALHTVISAGAFCVHLPEPKPQSQRPQTSTQQHTGAPSTTAPFTIISLFCNFSLSNISDFETASVNGTCLFPLLPLSTKMLIASQSQSLKRLTYCVDSIPSLLSPFMWVLMYCRVSAL